MAKITELVRRVYRYEQRSALETAYPSNVLLLLAAIVLVINLCNNSIADPGLYIFCFVVVIAAVAFAFWLRRATNAGGIAKLSSTLFLAFGVVCSKRLLNQAVGKFLRTHNLKSKKGAQVMRKNEKITALYERLSRDDFGKDDDQQRESNSISNQKAMLEDFAARQGFTNIVHFTDDGISGTCFDRPGFTSFGRMASDIIPAMRTALRQCLEHHPLESSCHPAW